MLKIINVCCIAAVEGRTEHIYANVEDGQASLPCDLRLYEASVVEHVVWTRVSTVCPLLQSTFCFSYDHLKFDFNQNCNGRFRPSIMKFIIEYNFGKLFLIMIRVLEQIDGSINRSKHDHDKLSFVENIVPQSKCSIVSILPFNLITDLINCPLHSRERNYSDSENVCRCQHERASKSVMFKLTENHRIQISTIFTVFKTVGERQEEQDMQNAQLGIRNMFDSLNALTFESGCLDGPSIWSS